MSNLKKVVCKFHVDNCTRSGVFVLPEKLKQWSELIENLCTFVLKFSIDSKLRLVLKSIIAACNIIQAEKIERDRNRNK